jgi:hypothetical protein
MAKDEQNPDQDRILVRIDRDILDDFRRFHPQHGAITKFVRTAMLHHIDRLKKIEESLHGTKSVSAQRDPSEERQGLN